MNNTIKNYSIFIILLAGLVIAIIMAVGFGAVRIPAAEFIDILFRGIQTEHSTILLQIRLPRVLLCLVIGAGLAAVGTVMQGIFKNPLVDSYTLGMSSGAALGAVISIVTGISFSIGGVSTTGVFAFIGAVSTLFLVYNLAKRKNAMSVNSLLLAGVAVSYFLSAIISFLMLLNQDNLQHIVFWTMGSLSLTSWSKVVISYIIIIPGILALLFYARELNILTMGDESAQYLGIDVEKLKRVLLVICCIIVGAVVSVSGTIGFLGLVAPHIIRLIAGSDNKKVIPYSALLGAVLLIASDTVGRTIIQPVEIPVGVMTSIMGGPFFIFLLRKQR
ncbi:MAG: ABC-type Fe3+-siderophore transport system, permease component [Clostridia bacterium]|jgi:iron complex transport system permease protein|nr:ABC-type Fe3+-siderophore transport system, permease component [Clostridia bacterium]